MPQNRLADGHKSFIPKGLDCVPRPCSTPFLIARRLKGVKRSKTQADEGLGPQPKAGDTSRRSWLCLSESAPSQQACEPVQDRCSGPCSRPRHAAAWRSRNRAAAGWVAWATNAITEGRARFRIGTQWFSRSGCWNRRAPARPCGRGKLAQFSLLQRFAVWWVAPPWPILSVPAVLLALCRLVDSFPVKRSPPAQRLVGPADVAMRSFGGPFSDSRRDRTEIRYTVPGLVATASSPRSAENERPVGRVPPRLSVPFKGNWPRVWTGVV